MNPANIQDEFLCPISRCLMKEPVSLSCGHTFDKENIEQWLSNNSICPTCRTNVSGQSLVTNWTIKSMIDRINEITLDDTPAIKVDDNIYEIEMTRDIFQPVSATFHSKNSLINLCINVPESSERRPISFVCLIDVSGSMGEIVGNGEGGKAFTRLDLVKHVLNVIIASLTDSDCLSLITFSDEPSVLFELMHMTETNKKIARANVKALMPLSSTYTGPAIKCAYEEIRKSPKNHIKTILLLTDGQDTDGDEILQKTFDRIKKPDQVQFNTFGFSNDIYSESLVKLANKGDGIFGFIPDQSMIGTVFINFIANIFRTFCQNVLIKLNDDFEFKHGKTSLKKTILQFGKKHHFLIKSKNNSNNLSVKIGFAEDQMVELKLDELREETNFDIQLARHKMLELLEESRLPVGIDVNIYKNSDELNKIPEFLAEFKQINKKKDPNNEQISLGLKYWDTWGAHYFRCFRFGHVYEQAINFKSPSIKFYRTKKFDEIIDNLTDIFCTLPPPKPTGNSYGNSNGPIVSMSNIMDRNNGCILSSCLVKMANGQLKQINDLKKDDLLQNESKVVCNIKSKYDGDMIKINDLIITPYHPIFYNGKWKFPADIYLQSLNSNSNENYLENNFISLIQNRKSLNVCNLVLNKKHYANIEGFRCITLGHDYQIDVLKHPYYGTQKCIEDLSLLKGWNEGLIVLNNYKTLRDDNGTVCGTVDHECE